MKTMLLSRLTGFGHLLVASALCLGGVAGCADAGFEDLEASEGSLPDGRGVVAVLLVHLRPSAGPIEVVRAARADQSTYASYTRSTSTTTAFIDACAQPGASRSILSSPISQSLPFPFTLFGGGNATSFGTTSTKVNYNFKGVVTLESVVPPGGSNVSLPTTAPSAPRPAIFAFWDDLAYNSNGAICSASTGAAPGRIFVITWSDMKFATDAANTTSLTFSAYLYEGSDQVEIVYKKMTSTKAPARASGNSATVGLQDATGSVATAGSGNGATSTAASGATFRSYVFTPNF